MSYILSFFFPVGTVGSVHGYGVKHESQIDHWKIGRSRRRGRGDGKILPTFWLAGRTGEACFRLPGVQPCRRAADSLHQAGADPWIQSRGCYELWWSSLKRLAIMRQAKARKWKVPRV